MAILKIKEAGEEAVLAIASVEVVQGDYGSQVKFDTTAGDTLYVPESSVLRQLDRVGVAEVSELAGRYIHFSRAASKPGKAPYWNLDKARTGDPAPKTNGTSLVSGALLPNETGYKESCTETGAPPEADEATAFDGLLARYNECLTEAAGFGQRIQKVGIEVDGSAVAAIAATLFIARNQAKI